MGLGVRIFLTGTLLALFTGEFAWSRTAHIPINPFPIVVTIGLAVIPSLGAAFYTYVRYDERIAAVLFALAFLIVFAPACTLINFLALSVVGAPIDHLLLRADLAIGFDWRAMFYAVVANPTLLGVLDVAYRISAFQIIIPVVLIGFGGDPKDVSRLCVAVVISALATIAFWTWHPSVGPPAIYDITAMARSVGATIDTEHTKFLHDVLLGGMPKIDPMSAKGLVGFPSYHTQEILLALWYMRKQMAFFVPLAAFSIIALASVPLQGAHHLSDMFGGVVFAAAAIALAGRLTEVVR